jgi:hypothetical protein
LNDEEKKLIKELELLRKEHLDLDNMLARPETFDQITLQRLKKRKLWLKDSIISIEATIYPNIIA